MLVFTFTLTRTNLTLATFEAGVNTARLLQLSDSGVRQKGTVSVRFFFLSCETAASVYFHLEG